MKKIILTALSFMLLSFPYSSNAKVYTEENTIPCGEKLCDLNNKLITDEVQMYVDDNLLFEAYFLNGIPEGAFKGYYSNGKVKDVENYKNGKKEGISKSFYENGNIKNEMNFINGYAEGNSKSYYENGKREPSVDVLLKLSQLYQVSVDYLIGHDQVVDTSITKNEANMIEAMRHADERAQRDALVLLKLHKVTK